MYKNAYKFIAICYDKVRKTYKGGFMPKLSSNMEDYLEAIMVAEGKDGITRVTDVRDLLGVKTPSVSGALRVLAEKGYLKHEPYQGVKLTSKGRRMAQDVKARHIILSSFLKDVLGVKPKTADIDACKMEHTVSRETLDKLHEFLKKQEKKK